VTGRPPRSDQQILQALAEAHAATDSPLTVLRYTVWREQELARAPYRRAELPAHWTIYRRYGSFSAALQGAGVDLRQMTGRAEGVRFSNEQLLRALHDADLATTGRLTINKYLAWREERSAGDRALRSALPTFTTILQRFGSWSYALEQMRHWRTVS
jgi:hypothetical protein